MEQLAVINHNLDREEPVRDPLIVACQQGDQEAFQRLFERHKDRVYSIALHYSGNEATAHDIAQQVFLKLLTRIQQFNWQAAFSTWLYRLVANTCYDEQRRWRRWLPLEEVREVATFSTRGDLDTSLQQDEIAAAVQLAIRTLSPKLRMPILLKYIEGLSYEEIAQVLGCSMGTVASRLNRGHKSLAGKLGHLREGKERRDV
jgi:RNA polymerase sigma-70 factor, ECF subfamily